MSFSGATFEWDALYNYNVEIKADEMCRYVARMGNEMHAGNL
jgi:hypothetical protein